MEQAPSVIANCKIVNRIGQGGMGSVYRAVHQHLGRNIALKLLPAEFTRSEEYVTRFLREARAVANLSHPNVVTVHDAGEQDGQYYIAMELIEGGSLGVLMRKRGKVPEKAALEFLAQAGKGLAAAHDRGLIHRDIKPENMLVNKDGILKIVDFGLVLESTAQSHLTKTGTFLGTPVYMSPEQCDGAIADARSDLYSLGASFYTLLTGKPPFNAPTALGILYKHKFEAPPDPREADPTITEKCSQVLLKLMAKKREERYQSAKELVKDAEAALKTAPELPEDWSFDVIMGEILASMPEPPSITASPLTPGAMPTLTPGRSSPLSRTPATVANSSPPTLSGTPTGTPFPGTTGPLMPTLLTPGAGRTPAPLSTPGMEPTLVHPGSSSSRTAGATPPPGPLGEMYTPTQAVQAPKRAPWIWPAVAAAALLAVGLGGFFGYGAYQQSKFDKYVNECSEILKDKTPNLDDANIALTLARSINPNHSEIARLQAAIAEAKAKRESDLKKQGVEENEKLVRYKALLAQANGLIKNKNLPDAKKTLETALPIEGELVSNGAVLDKVGTLASVLINEVNYDMAFQRGEEEVRAGKLEDAIDAFKDAENWAISKDKKDAAERRKKEIQYQSKMAVALAADKAEKVENWDEALKAAKEAWMYFSDPAQPEQKIEAENLLRRLKDRKDFEAELGKASELDKEGKLKEAEEYVAMLRVNLGPEPDQHRVETLDKMARDFKMRRLTRDVKDAKEGGHQEVEGRLLGDLIALNPPDVEALKARLAAIEAERLKNTNLETALEQAQSAYKAENWSKAKMHYEDASKFSQDDLELKAKILECEVRVDAAAAKADEDAKKWGSALDKYGKALAKLQNSDGQDALKEELIKGQARIQEAKLKIETLLKDADDAAKEKRYDDAIKKYEALIAVDPEKEMTYQTQIKNRKEDSAYAATVKAGDDALVTRTWTVAIEQYGKAAGTRPNAQVDARRALAEGVRSGEEAEKAKDWKAAAEGYGKALAQWTAANLSTLPDLKKEMDGKKKTAETKAATIGNLTAALGTAVKNKDLVGQMRAYKSLLGVSQDLSDTAKNGYAKANGEAIEAYKSYAEKLTGDRSKLSEAKAAWNNLILYDEPHKADYEAKLTALAAIKSPEEVVAEAIRKAQGFVAQSRFQEARQALGGDVQTNYGSNANLKEATGAIEALLDAEKQVAAAKEKLDKGIALLQNDLDELSREKGQLESVLKSLNGQAKPGSQEFASSKFKDAESRAKSGGESALNSARSALSGAARAASGISDKYKPTSGGGSGRPKRHDNAGEEGVGTPTASQNTGKPGDPAKMKKYGDAADALNALAR